LVIALILVIVNFGLNLSYSQGTTDTLVNPQLQDSSMLKQFNVDPAQNNTKWNQTLVNDPENILCDRTGECGGIVEDAFESNNTIALESFNRYRIFDTVHMIRNTDGFQIVDVSINPQDEDTKYLVAMSK
jgi:hypothetical protein